MLIINLTFREIASASVTETVNLNHIMTLLYLKYILILKPLNLTNLKCNKFFKCKIYIKCIIFKSKSFFVNMVYSNKFIQNESSLSKIIYENTFHKQNHLR